MSSEPDTPVAETAVSVPGGDGENDIESERSVLEDDDFDACLFDPALYNNSDYRLVMRTIVSLLAQKKKAYEQRDMLVYLQKEVENNPKQFVESLKNGRKLDIQTRIKVVEEPEIDWSKYNYEVSKPSNNRPLTRHSTGSVVSTGSPSTSSADTLPSESVDSDVLVRGRKFNDSKPITFNQLWTPEEQIRLDELLLQYPSEEIEMRRYKKISAALGNRTPLQVQSRVQKLHKKLQNVTPHVRKSSGRPLFSHLLKTSSFFGMSSHLVSNPADWKDGSESDGSGSIPDNSYLRQIEMKVLQNVMDEERIVNLTHESGAVHNGVKCAECHMFPLSGARWMCTTCAVDICSWCLIDKIKGQKHWFHSYHSVRLNTQEP